MDDGPILGKVDWKHGMPTPEQRRVGLALTSRIEPAETVEAATEGTVDDWEAVAVLTDRRILIAHVEWFRVKIDAFDVPGVTLEPDAGPRDFVFLAPGRRIRLRLPETPAGRAFRQRVETKLHPPESISFRPFGTRNL